MSMQMNRLFEMVYLLLERDTVTAGELARRFEVSTRTIYRDVELLSGAGIPIYAAKGRGGGIGLLPDFVLNKSLLSEEEQREILFALQSLRATGGGQGSQVLNRLAALFQKESGDWIDVDFSSWGSPQEERQRFSLLKQGILEGKVVSFAYDSSCGERTLRQAEPVRLCFKNSCWYLQAFCLERQEYRTFKICRMRELALTDLPAQSRETPVPPLDAGEAEAGEPVELRLRFSRQLAFRVWDEFDSAQVKVCEDGSLTTVLRCPPGGWIVSYLLSFGDGVEVLSPPEVRKALREQAEKIARQYRTSKEI